MIKILFLAANPTDTDRLRLDEEVRAIDEALRESEFRDRFELHTHWAVRIEDLQKLLLRYQPDIVHFSGHGQGTPTDNRRDPSASGAEGVDRHLKLKGAEGAAVPGPASQIVLENDSGSSEPVPPDALSDLFRVFQDNIRCVVLNACYTQGQADGISQHVECVVGMSNAIPDVTAVAFAAAFYSALGYGRSLLTAFALACNRVDLASLPESHVPRLLAPDADPNELFLLDKLDPDADSAPAQQVIHGDAIEGDKIGGDKFGGDKVGGDKTDVGDVSGLAAVAGGVLQIQGNVYLGVGSAPADEAEDIEQVEGEPPYQGLRFFNTGDANRFFGRERLTAELVAYLRDHRFLAVIGASGSGKSSLVRAGLVDALRQGEALENGTLPPEGCTQWPVHVITPKAHPLEQLAGSLTRGSESVTAQSTLMDDMTGDTRSLHLYANRLVAQQSANRLLLVVDQFEELYTLCRDENERRAFVENLLTAAAPDGVTVVVLTLRADFYHRCAEPEALRTALQNNQLYIGPMTQEELRRAIERPALENGWNLETGLVDLLLDDMANESGALPLLSHALLETWRRRRGSTLTLAGYAASGRVQGAIAQTAEAIFRQKLNGEQRTIARNIFVRLTELGEGVQDTRRRVALTELVPHGEDAPEVETVLKTLADARLITTDRDTKTGQEEAEVAHEALIREWGTLRNWLQNDREGLRIHRHLTEATQAWLTMEREPGELYRGTRLDQTSAWAENHTDELNEQEQAFLDTSLAERQREIDEKERVERDRENARQRELEQSRRLAQEAKKREQAQIRATNRMRLFVISLAVLLALAVGAGWWIQQQSVKLANSNEDLRQQTEDAEFEKRRARASELAALAQITMDSDSPDMLLALRLAREAITTTLETNNYIVPNARVALVQAVVNAPPWLLTIHTDEQGQGNEQIEAASILSAGGYAEFSPDGRHILGTIGKNVAYIWDSRTGRNVRTLRGHNDTVNWVSYSPDGGLIVTASSDGTVRIWDVDDTAALMVPDTEGSAVTHAIFSPNGESILTSTEHGKVQMWDASDGTNILTLVGHSYAVNSAAFNPQGNHIVTGGVDKTARFWDANTGEKLKSLVGHEGIVRSVCFSPDSEHVLSASDDGTVRVWSTVMGTVELLLQGHQAPVYLADYSPDGRYILTASDDGTARIWNAENGLEVQRYTGHSGRVISAKFNGNGSKVVTVSADHTIRIGHSPHHPALQVLQGHIGQVLSVAYQPGADRIVTAGGNDRSARVWDIGNSIELMKLTGHTRGIRMAIYSFDGEFIATASWDSTIRIWDADTGSPVNELLGHTSLVRTISFSPNDKQIVSGGADGTVRLWDVATSTQQTILSEQQEAVFAAVFSPSGEQIAFGGFDRKVRLWDVQLHSETGILVGHKGTVRSISYRSDGKRILTASSDGTARIWDVESQSQLQVLRNHTDEVYSASYSPSGNNVVTASRDGTARVWDGSSGDELLTFHGHKQQVFSAKFSEDGKQIVSVGGDEKIRFWPSDIESYLTIAEALIRVATE